MQRVQRNEVSRITIFLCYLVVMVGVPACFLSGQAGSGSESTRVAIQVQQTLLSHDQAALTQAALTAQAGPDLAQAATEAPVDTPAPTQTPETALASPTPSATPQIDELDERTLKSARILLFEDMSASGKVRLVKEALDLADYFYLDVGSAKGWFKTQLASGQEWDLIIAAAEADRNFGGEYFELLDDRLEAGAAVVIEYRDLDLAPDGMARPLLDRCGVKFQSDWFEPDLRVFYLLEPDHPIFHQPNRVLNFRNAPEIWKGDVGDLFEIKYREGKPVGDAQLLMGTNTLWKNDHGLLVNCIDGRLIIQSFASHEYQYGDVVPMWQNYVYQALKGRFRVALPPAPTPAITVAPSATAVMTSTQTVNPLPFDPLASYSCGGLMEARLTRSPLYQKQLFEHHAVGTFMILRLELLNQSGYPIQIWDDDYSVEGRLFGKDEYYTPDEAATGYLFIEGGGKLYQDRIDPGQVWRTQLAFDVDPQGEDRILVVRPGSKFDEQVCEVRIPIP
jgi:hypothetical protein